MWVEQSSFRASRRWSRLAERCTCVQASGPRWCPLPNPASGFWFQICPLWCFGSRSGHGSGRAWCPHACLHGVCVHRPVRAPLLLRCTSRIACSKDPKQQWCAGRRQATALAGEGMVKALNEYASMRMSGNVPCSYLRVGARPSPSSFLPPPGVRLARFYFDPAPRTHKPALLPNPLPLPLCLPLIHSVSTMNSRQGTPKYQPPNPQASKPPSISLQTRHQYKHKASAQNMCTSHDAGTQSVCSCHGTVPGVHS